MSHVDLASLSLEGLSIGDSLGATFGEGVATADAVAEFEAGILPTPPWQWTDDTHMALAVVEVLIGHGEINQDVLAERFAERYADEPFRGYGEGAAWLLQQLSGGEHWRELADQVFHGGSYGNGAAMRAAPIGGFFAGDPKSAAEEARKSAVITHAHPEGQAGAIAVAVAASIAAGQMPPSGSRLIDEILPLVPESETREGIRLAAEIPPDQLGTAVNKLGAGWNVSAQDTVPLCLWCAAHHLNDFEAAIWQTLGAGGDRDTTCAIVGGIVAPAVGAVPDAWVAAREPFPDDFEI